MAAMICSSSDISETFFALRFRLGGAALESSNECSSKNSIADTEMKSKYKFLLCQICVCSLSMPAFVNKLNRVEDRVPSFHPLSGARVDYGNVWVRRKRVEARVFSTLRALSSKLQEHKVLAHEILDALLFPEIPIQNLAGKFGGLCKSKVSILVSLIAVIEKRTLRIHKHPLFHIPRPTTSLGERIRSVKSSCLTIQTHTCSKSPGNMISVGALKMSANRSALPPPREDPDGIHPSSRRPKMCKMLDFSPPLDSASRPLNASGITLAPLREVEAWPPPKLESAGCTEDPNCEPEFNAFFVLECTDQHCRNESDPDRSCSRNRRLRPAYPACASLVP